ncbi:chymotrypsin-2-like [Trichogramma pretiosum]|uniref:chymotrypsin-2-like n=1 Tax=Trichogramma pretiosum TaxID=7493 RepID=UPI0006C956A3|nr:chymotrypsin-2-like [Trichogramma pretiosum]
MLLYFILVLSTILTASIADASVLPVEEDDDVVSRVTQGVKARDGQFPHNVQLRHNQRFLCGGSIIHKRYILTAAHCLYDFTNDTQAIKVTVGTNQLRDGDATVYNAEALILHEKYTPKLLDVKKNKTLQHNDIALIRLTQDIEFKDKVKPIELATTDNYYNEGNKLIITGWGRRGSNITGLPNDMLMAMANVHNFKDCVATWDRVTRIDEGMFCYRGPKKESSCNGDSGGPAISVQNNRLIGIVKGSYFCGEDKYPSLLMKVSYYVPWIKKNMIED